MSRCISKSDSDGRENAFCNTSSGIVVAGKALPDCFVAIVVSGRVVVIETPRGKPMAGLRGETRRAL